MNGHTPEEIERHVIREIEKHRRLRDEAVTLETRANEVSDEAGRQNATMAYVAAMIAVHAQQTVVSTLLDILGYMPEMPKTKVH
jgi:hypothetical protein